MGCPEVIGKGVRNTRETRFMTYSQDPTDPIRRKAVTFPAVAKGTSCTQSSFKAGRGTFLFIGPGAKGQGFKAMFRLQRSLPQARKLAAKEPDRFEVGSTDWVTTRFTTERPLAKSIWEKWLEESYNLICDSPAGEKKRAAKTKVAKKNAKTKKTARKR
jgi:hypothetical protein